MSDNTAINVTISERAAIRISRILSAEPGGTALRISVSGGGCSGFQYGFDLDRERAADDIVVERDGAVVVIDPVSLPYMGGSEIDFVDDLIGQSFQIHNRNATASCGCGTSFGRLSGGARWRGQGKDQKKPPASHHVQRRARPAAPKPKAAGAPARSARGPPQSAPPVPARVTSKPQSAPLMRGDFVLEKLAQVALTATNLDLAVSFYRDILGLKFIARFDPPGLAFFQLSGGTRLLLSSTASQAHLYFVVDDVNGAVNELKKRGVAFLHPPALVHRDEAGNFGKKGAEEWMAFFKDPSGNLIGLIERR